MKVMYFLLKVSCLGVEIFICGSFWNLGKKKSRGKGVVNIWGDGGRELVIGYLGVVVRRGDRIFVFWVREFLWVLYLYII